MHLPSWPAPGEYALGRSVPVVSCWPKHPVPSGASWGTDAWVCLLRASLFHHPTPGLGWSPQVRPRSLHQPTPGRVP